MYVLIIAVFRNCRSPYNLMTISHDVSVKEMIASIYTDIVATGGMNFALAVPDPFFITCRKN